MRNSLRLAWLSSVRQPARTALGMLGVIAVGALLFDMLLLSRGLVLSFRDLLDRVGFDVRVLSTEAAPFTGPQLDHATRVAADLRALPQIEAVLLLRIRNAEIATQARNDDQEVTSHKKAQFIGADRASKPMWTILEGRDLPGAGSRGAPLLVNRNVARLQNLSIGSSVLLHGACGPEREALPPVAFTVIGIAEFPFDDVQAETVAGTLDDLHKLCGDGDDDRADMLLVRANARVGPGAAAAAIRALHPELHVLTNEEIVERFSRVEFSYFEQLSFVLATVTLFFGFLLIAVLLTVSVNQRLGEIAALRAIGLTRGRVMAGVLWESALVIGGGGTLAVPVGFALSMWLDRILRALPGIPASISFFVFEPRTLWWYLLLLGLAAVGAAFYPMRIIGTLPIAGTLRREIVS